MAVTDNFDNRKYQNKSVEFSKIQKPSIVAALQYKDIKEIKCIVFNNFRQDNLVSFLKTGIKRGVKPHPPEKQVP